MQKYPKILLQDKKVYVTTHLTDGLRVMSNHADIPTTIILKENGEPIPRTQWHSFIDCVLIYHFVISTTETETANDWCNEHCKGYWDSKVVAGFRHVDGGSPMRFRFENHDDAAFFKLSWA